MVIQLSTAFGWPAPGRGGSSTTSWGEARTARRRPRLHGALNSLFRPLSQIRRQTHQLPQRLSSPQSFSFQRVTRQTATRRVAAKSSARQATLDETTHRELPVRGLFGHAPVGKRSGSSLDALPTPPGHSSSQTTPSPRLTMAILRQRLAPVMVSRGTGFERPAQNLRHLQPRQRRRPGSLPPTDLRKMRVSSRLPPEIVHAGPLSLHRQCHRRKRGSLPC